MGRDSYIQLNKYELDAETKVTTTNITELKGSILIDQFATKSPELIHSNIL